MRNLLVFVSAAVLLWLIGELLRLPLTRVPWLLLAYFAAHAAQTLLSWWTLQRVPLDSPEYFRLYAAGMLPMIVAAAALAEKYSAGWGTRGVSAALVIAAGSLALCYIVWTEFPAPQALHPVVMFHFFTIAVFLGCGAATFVSLLAPSSGIETATKLALAGFWLSFGGYQLAYAIAHRNAHLTGVVRMQWGPTFLALVAFAWLALRLHGGQAELARQLQGEFHAIEQQQVHVVFDRSGE
jgi:hypothetical protein